MGFIFKKTVKIAPGIKLNFSKKGISTSIGRRGASVNVGKRGTYMNLGIPGTGVSFRNKIISGNKKSSSIVYNNNHPSENANTIQYFQEPKLWYGKKANTPMLGILYILGFVFLFFQSAIASILLIIAIVLTLRYIFSTTGKAVMKLDKANKFYASNKIPLTVKTLIEAVELEYNPFLPQLISQLSYEIGDYNNCIIYGEKIENKNSETLSMLANSYHKKGDLEKAIDYFNVLVKDLSNIEAENVSLNLGKIYFQKGDFVNSLRYSQKVTDNNDDFDEAILMIGKSFFHLNEFESAIYVLSDFIGQKKKYSDEMVEMAYIIGLCYKLKEDKSNSLKWLKKVYSNNIDFKDTGKLIAEMEL